MIFIYSRQDKTESRDEIIREKNLIAILWSRITKIFVLFFFFQSFSLKFLTLSENIPTSIYFISIRIIRTNSDPTDFFFFILFVVIASNCNFYKTA